MGVPNPGDESLEGEWEIRDKGKDGATYKEKGKAACSGKGIVARWRYTGDRVHYTLLSLLLGVL
jgi:hypothetical protein